MPDHYVSELSLMDRAAVDALVHQVGSVLRDPGRLEAAYSAKFAAEPMRERLALIGSTARDSLMADESAISLLLADEQVELSTGGTYPARDSYCQFVTAASRPMEVSDSTRNLLVCDLVSTTEMGVRSYLGVPLVWDGETIGAMCVWNKKPRVWMPYEVQVLMSFAALALDTLHWSAADK